MAIVDKRTCVGYADRIIECLCTTELHRNVRDYLNEILYLQRFCVSKLL